MISSVSLIRCRFITFKAIFYAILCVGSIWLFTLAAILFAFAAFDNNIEETRTVATGAIYAGVFATALILTVAVVAPALLLLQPMRLWRVLREEKHALTPRQRFRGQYFNLSPQTTFFYSQLLQLYTLKYITLRTRQLAVSWPCSCHPRSPYSSHWSPPRLSS